eukprot:403357802
MSSADKIQLQKQLQESQQLNYSPTLIYFFNMSQSVIMNNQQKNIISSSNDNDLIFTVNSINDNHMVSFDIHGKTTLDRRQAYLNHQNQQNKFSSSQMQQPDHMRKSTRVNNFIDKISAQDGFTNNNDGSSGHAIENPDLHTSPQQKMEIKYKENFSNHVVFPEAEVEHEIQYFESIQGTQNDNNASQLPLDVKVKRRFKPRSFIKKTFAFYKQCNPVINTWKYYMRLLPRWVRAFLILLTIECDIILVVLSFQIAKLKFNYDDQDSPKLFYQLNITFISSLVSFSLLYIATKFISISVASKISPAKNSLDVIKKLKLIRKRSGQYQRALFFIASLISILALLISTTQTTILTIPQDYHNFRITFTLTLMFSMFLILIGYDIIYAVIYTILYKMAKKSSKIRMVFLFVNKQRAWKVKRPVNV